MISLTKTALTVVACLPIAVVPGCSGHDSHDDSAEEAPATEAHGEEDHIELTQEQFRSAGIEVVQSGPGQVSDVLTLPGSVAPNADSVLHVTPRVAGQVRSVFKHLGEGVEAGELLCIIDSVDLGEAVANYMRDRGKLEAAEETLTSERALYETRIASLVTVLDGAIAVQDRIFRREEELQEKAVSTVRPLLEADKALQAAKLDKDRQLIELTAQRDSRVLSLQVDLRAKRVDLTAAANRLRTLGIEEDVVDGLTDASPLLSGEYRVVASGSGIVVDRHVSAGEYVEAGSKLFVVEDLSNVWFVASAFEEQLRSLRSGQVAYVSLDAFPDTVLNGTVSFLDYHVDPTSRSIGVRITLDNQQLDSWPEELPLRPGMFGRVDLETSSRTAAIVLPERALVHDDEGDYVFVQVEPFAFERREVDVRPAAGEMVEITRGLEAGESIAVTGTFLLKSAERQGELGGGHAH